MLPFLVDDLVLRKFLAMGEGRCHDPVLRMPSIQHVCDPTYVRAGLTVFAIGPCTLAQGQTLVAQVNSRLL